MNIQTIIFPRKSDNKSRFSNFREVDLWKNSILSSSSTKIKTKMLHTKFHWNRIINEDFEIWEGDGRGTPVANFVFIFNQNSKKDYSYKVSSKSDNT